MIVLMKALLDVFVIGGSAAWRFILVIKLLYIRLCPPFNVCIVSPCRTNGCHQLPASRLSILRL